MACEGPDPLRNKLLAIRFPFKVEQELLIDSMLPCATPMSRARRLGSLAP